MTKKAYPLTVVLCCFVLWLHAQTTTWTGNTDNDWNTATNWSDGLPAAGNDAIIPDFGTPVLTLTANTVIDYAVNNAGTLTVDLAGFNLNSNGMLVNNGMYSINGSGAFSNLNLLNNNGILTVNSVFTNSFTGTVINNGTAEFAGTTINFSLVENLGTLLLNADFDNGGTINNRPDAVLTNAANFDNLDGETVLNEGTLEIIAPGIWTNFGTLDNGGLLRNLNIFTNQSTGIVNNLAAGSLSNEFRFTNLNSIDNAGMFENTSCSTFTGRTGSISVNTGAGTFTNNGIVYRTDDAVIEITDGTGVVFTDENEFAAPSTVCFTTITKELDTSGNYVLTLDEIDNGSTVGYCTVASRTLSQTEFDCDDTGENSVILTIVDGLGTANTCETTVTIEDNEQPTINCPANITRNYAPGDCNTPVEYEVTGSDNCGGPVFQSDDSGFTSGDVFPEGLTFQEYKISDGGFTATCSFTVSISGSDTSEILTCNDQLNISLDANCNFTLNPDALLEGQPVCAESFIYEINDEPAVAVDASYLGQNITFRVTNTATGNSCWGNALIEDKLAPQITGCEADTLTCLQNPDPVSEGGDVLEPIFSDCSDFFTFYTDDVVSGGCADEFSQIITRTWTATDIGGFTATCAQIIYVERIDIISAQPECPADVTAECTPGEAFDLSPENTGYPTLTVDGTLYTLSEESNELCGIVVSFSDNDLEMCNGAQKIVRTWTIYDWCEPVGTDTNPFTCTQFIEITDNTPPVITPPADFTAEVDDDCLAVFDIPAATFVDCSAEITWTTDYEEGIINGNGGTISTPGLTVGTYTITFTATDACGNVSTATTTVTIEDNLPPIAVCRQDVAVVLNSANSGEVFASTVDDNSFDNCCLESVLIARTDDNCGNPDDLLFDESVLVCCADTEQDAMVILQVTDCYGNQNICMAPIEVTDDEAPMITCPPDQTVECDALTLPENTGEATATDNCGEVTVTFSDTDNLDCTGGMIMRTFIATDVAGLSDTCMQTVLVLSPEMLSEEDILCPPDYETEGCTASTEPEITGAPVVTPPPCVEVEITYEDVILPGSGEVCLKIVRTWMIIDVCVFDGNPDNGGYFECVQSIFINATEAPTVSCPGSAPMFCSTQEECAAEEVDLSVTVADDCTPAEDLLIFWTVDLNNDGIEDTGVTASGVGQNTTNTYSVGTHQITYTVKDDCGTEAECSFVFVVNDCGNPVVVCPEEIIVEISADGTVELESGQTDLSGSTDNCADSANLLSSFSENTADITRVFDCADVGSPVLVTLFLTDPEGNQGSCSTFVTVQDNQNFCPNNLMIAGLISLETGQTVEQVAVRIEGSEMTEAMTDAAGHYEYAEGGYGQNYLLTPQSGADYGNGITTWDVLLIRKHVLQTEILNSPYRLIAADVNNSGTVTTADAIALRSYILQLSDDFPNNTSWRYIDANYAFPDPSNPWTEDFPEAVQLDALNGDMMLNDFIAVKTGDLNGTVITSGYTDTDGEERNGETFKLRTDNRNFAAGEEISIEIFAENAADIAAYQMTLDFDVEALEFVDIKPGQNHQRNNFGLRRTDEGAVICSWDNVFASDINESASLFSVVFRTRRVAALSEVLNLGSRFARAVAYTESGEPWDIRLNFTGKEIPSDNLFLYQNVPNPFRENTVIGYNLTGTQTAVLRIYDAAGKLIYTAESIGRKGYNEFTVKAGDIPMKGILYYEISAGSRTVTKKMLITN